jgi:hypothetical protein
MAGGSVGGTTVAVGCAAPHAAIKKAGTIKNSTERTFEFILISFL